MMGGGGYFGHVTTYTPRRPAGMLHLDRIEKWADYARTDVAIGDGPALAESYEQLVSAVRELGKTIERLERRSAK